MPNANAVELLVCTSSELTKKSTKSTKPHLVEKIVELLSVAQTYGL
jgi:hypothetical protein